MAESLATSRVTDGDAFTTIDRRKLQIFFQRFAGVVPESGIPGLAFTLNTAAGATVTGVTPPNGLIEFFLVAGETATLQILGTTYTLSALLGGLQPVTSLAGTQQRLNMLGYNSGPPTTSLLGTNALPASSGINEIESCELAIINFQSDHKPLLIDAVAGVKTQPALVKAVKSAGGE